LFHFGDGGRRRVLGLRPAIWDKDYASSLQIIPFDTPHSVKFGPNGARLFNTFAVEKDKPLVDPMP
jgi:hypothetical protein